MVPINTIQQHSWLCWWINSCVDESTVDHRVIKTCVSCTHKPYPKKHTLSFTHTITPGLTAATEDEWLGGVDSNASDVIRVSLKLVDSLQRVVVKHSDLHVILIIKSMNQIHRIEAFLVYPIIIFISIK